MESRAASSRMSPPGRAAPLTGKPAVVVRVTVNATGDVTQAVVERSFSPYFSKFALEAARQWKFIPGRRRGPPSNGFCDSSSQKRMLTSLLAAPPGRADSCRDVGARDSTRRRGEISDLIFSALPPCFPRSALRSQPLSTRSAAPESDRCGWRGAPGSGPPWRDHRQQQRSLHAAIQGSVALMP